MIPTFDMAILGSGFGGSLTAMIARRLGLSVLLIERGSHPRFAIGESTSPLTNLLLEEIATTYDLPRLLPFTAFGTWQRAYPEVGMGLKRGFTFYHQQPGETSSRDADRDRQLLVAASPNDEVADTHWYRPDFDDFFVREARELGAEYVDHTEVHSLTRDGLTSVVSGVRQGQSVSYRARFVVDASGSRGATFRLLDLPESEFPGYPQTEALFSHFTGVGHYSHRESGAADGPPYPPDDSALHHLFEGGWMWVLRFRNGITSAGAALEPWLARELRTEAGAEGAWLRLLERFPTVREQFRDAEATLPFVHARKLPFLCRPPDYPGLALLPSAMAFVDPLLSTGFPLTLLGIQRLARLLERSQGSPSSEDLRTYTGTSLRESARTARLIAACYRCFGDFRSFAELTMLYFAAASFSEMARRLGRHHLSTEFLLGNQPRFTETFERGCTLARECGHLSPTERAALCEGLGPFNIAGLCDPAKRNWYGVDLGDVVRGAAKLEATPTEVEKFFRDAGWMTCHVPTGRASPGL